MRARLPRDAWCVGAARAPCDRPSPRPNGITISPDGRVLFVADADHIQALDLRSGSTWRVATPDTVNVSGSTGWRRERRPDRPSPAVLLRIARYPLDAAWRRIQGRQLLEANTPDGRTSTTGEVVGDEYVYIGNSQIDRMKRENNRSCDDGPDWIYRVRLRGDPPAPCRARCAARSTARPETLWDKWVCRHLREHESDLFEPSDIRRFEPRRAASDALRARPWAGGRVLGRAVPRE